MFRVCQKALDMWVFEVESRRHVSVQGLEGPKVNAQSTKMFGFLALPPLKNVGFESVLRLHTLEVLVFFVFPAFFCFVPGAAIPEALHMQWKGHFYALRYPLPHMFFQNMP